MRKLLRRILRPSDYHLIKFVKNTFWSRMFVGITAFLVVLAMLSIWGAGFLEKIVDPIKYTKANELILEAYPESRPEATQSKTNLIYTYLKSNPHVLSFKPVSAQNLTDILKDWSEVFDGMQYVPLPTIIHVTLNPKGSYSPSDLQLGLSQHVSGVYAQSEKTLATHLASSLNFSKDIVWLILAFIFAIAVIVVLFATIGLVYAQRESLEVVSFLGATVSALANEFSLWIFRYSLIGMGIGLVSSWVIIEIVSLISSNGWVFLPPVTLFKEMIAVLILMLIEATLVANLCVKKVLRWVC